jgi:hypothetical protein
MGRGGSRSSSGRSSSRGSSHRSSSGRSSSVTHSKSTSPTATPVVRQSSMMPFAMGMLFSSLFRPREIHSYHYPSDRYLRTRYDNDSKVFVSGIQIGVMNAYLLDLV